MGFIGRFIDFAKKNLHKNLEVISKVFGSTLRIWSGALFTIAIGLATGQPIVWGSALAIGLGATANFVDVVLRCIFGKKTEEEIIDDD